MQSKTDNWIKSKYKKLRVSSGAHDVKFLSEKNAKKLVPQLASKQQSHG